MQYYIFTNWKIQRNVYPQSSVFGFKYHANLTCHAKFGFSFPLSRKIFRLQFSLIFWRKNRSEAFCVSSENILHLTFPRLLSVACDSILTIANIQIRLELTAFFRKKKPSPSHCSKRVLADVFYIFSIIFFY